MQQRIRRYKRAGMMLLILAASFLCSKFFLQLALIQGDSMEPSYHHLQLVLVNKLTKSFSRGDVIVFRKRGVHGLLIKRVAACPGDDLIIRDGTLFINGQAADDLPYIDSPGRAGKELSLEEGYYFVLGDNVNHSIDSRNDEIENVAQTQIIGRVVKIQCAFGIGTS